MAFLDCRKGKRSTRAVQEFEEDLARNLRCLLDDLISGEYQIGTSRCFVVTHPQPREIWAGDFRDRIVHHLVYNRTAPMAFRTFSADSCACIPDRGTLYGANRLERHIRSSSRNWSRRVFYLKMDLSNFFVSIHKPTLAPMLDKFAQDPFTRSLARQILFHDPTQNVLICSSRQKLRLVPRRKSLFYAPEDCGLAIGNLPSQFGANVYLDVLDKFVNHQLRPAGYIRYVDDFVLLHEDPDWLRSAQQEIETLLWDQLRLRANPSKTVLNVVDQGVDFVGQVLKPWHRTARATLFPAAWEAIVHSPDNASRLATANSYLGLLRQVSGFRQRKALCDLSSEFGLAAGADFEKVISASPDIQPMLDKSIIG